MSYSRKLSKLERLKSLEIDLANSYGEAMRNDLGMAATLIGAAMEDVGRQIEQHHGAVELVGEQRNRFNN
jgi:hypothetical protein